MNIEVILKQKMFQNLASYLLGAVMSAPNPQEEVDATRAATVENTSGGYGRLRATDDYEEGEWVLVDRDSEGNSEAGSLGSLDDLDFEDPTRGTASPLSTLRPKARTRSSSTSSLPSSTAMEESWFITPPPCFTSAGPIEIETSPLENLLIEHPSMSVYHIHQLGRRHLTTTVVPMVRTASVSPRRPASVVDLLAGDDLFDLVEEVVLDEPVVRNNSRQEGQARAAGTTQGRRFNRLQFVQQQDRQLTQYRKAQKVQRQKQYQNVRRNALDRNDKAREVNGRNRRQRRGERSQGATRSFANNNRKCC
ncbi:unnamed protein product [Acanthoscelides obtectus]|uniref:Tumor protein p53-inducible nuclear protein 1 n=1 Tax=Acanthoscelides obtectus TaxID=200917 RepID=A0A9P0PNE2_ACAOB|nr:unnamed protein product [Acanthoscelides obtectus]CAK1646503.1 Tumor protein p53-inducible nuclear protein 1 [Acanthoscelides obtectus]